MPDQLATIQAKGVEGADGDEVFDGFAAEAGAVAEVVDGVVLGRPLARGRFAFEDFFVLVGDALDVAETDADSADLTP